MGDLPDYTKMMVLRYEGGFIGLEELAVRLGFPGPWDLRGNLLLLEDFETEETEWTLSSTGSGSSAVRQTRHKYSGDWAVKLLSADVASADAELSRYFSAPEAAKIAYFTRLGWEGGDADLIFSGTWTYGTTQYTWGIRFNQATCKLEYLNSALGYTELAASLNLGSGEFTWWPFIIVVDLTTGYYVRVVVGGMEYDIPDAELNSAVTAESYSSYVSVINEAVAAAGGTVYVDSLLVANNVQ